MNPRLSLLAIVALFALPQTRADELKLKDGTKIVGTIVGFEENSFKVKTSYGFAVVQKDQVVSISMNADAKAASAAKPDSAPAAEAPKPVDAVKPSTPNPSTPGALPPSSSAPWPSAPPPPLSSTVAKATTPANAALAPQAANTGSIPPAAVPKPAGAAKAITSGAPAISPGPSPAPSPSVAKLPSPPKTVAAETTAQPATPDAPPAKPEPTSASAAPILPKSADNSPAPAPQPAHDNRTDAAISASARPSPVATNAPAPNPAPVTAPVATPVAVPVAAMQPIRETVVGNTYTNETYGFQMYKPPTWEVIAGVPGLLPGAIAAMGTNDQTTYLLVGQEAAAKSLSATKEATQRRLRDIMDNFRPLGETTISLSGVPATEIRFRGGVDAHDWSGVAVFVARGPRLFTIFGMTLADSDLVQIQENVIARAISSLQFTRQ
jgi:hypothetical protein